MGRFSQTLARLGAGYSVCAALVWLLWPTDLGFADNPEAWFVLGTAVVVWHLTEFKYSEELSAGRPTKSDEEFARRLVRLHQNELRVLLKDVNLWQFLETEIHKEMWALIDDFQRGKIFFSNATIQTALIDFIDELAALRHRLADETQEEFIGGTWMIGYKPLEIVAQEAYDQQMERSKEADSHADLVWDRFEKLITKLRVFVPDAYLNTYETN